MHDMVVHVLRAVHEVANQLRIRRYAVIQRIFHRPDRGQPVHQRAHAADALCEGPGIARVAPLQNDLDAAHHGAGRPGLCNAIAIHLRLDAQVPLDAGYRINNDTFTHSRCLSLYLSLPAGEGWGEGLGISSCNHHSVF